jgi:hypothetical protein
LYSLSLAGRRKDRMNVENAACDKVVIYREAA